MTASPYGISAEIKMERSRWSSERVVAAIIAVMVTAACAPAKRQSFEDVADRLNPILVTMIPKVAAFASYASTADVTDPMLLRLCRAADAELERMSHVKLAKELDLDRRRTTVVEDAASMLNQLEWGACWKASEQRMMTTCKWFCLDRWGHLRKVLIEFQAEAMAEGVRIYGLPPLPAAEL